MEFLFTSFAYLVILIMSDLNKWKQMAFLNRMNRIDKQLMKQLNIDLEYEKLRRTNIFSMSVIAILYIVIISIDAAILFDNSVSFELSNFGLILNYLLDVTTSGFCSFTYINYIDIVRLRFVKLNETIKSILSRKWDIEGNDKLKTLVTLQKTNEILCLTRFYKDLCSCIIDLNGIFGVIMVVTICHDFTLITSQLYLIFYIFVAVDNHKKYQYLIGLILWIFPNLLNQIFKCGTAFITCNEVNFVFYKIHLFIWVLFLKFNS